MGEISELMLNGSLCCQCGACLDESVIDQRLGFPVICDDCYESLSKKDKLIYKDRVESIFIDKIKCLLKQ